jgi:hypothetical protein
MAATEVKAKKKAKNNESNKNGDGHADDTDDSKNQAAAPKKKSETDALKNSNKDDTATDPKKKAGANRSRSTAGPEKAGAKRSRVTAGPCPREEFISSDHQSKPVVVSPDEADRVSSTWQREVVTYIKLTESFAKAWLRSPEEFLIAAVMQQRTQSSIKSGTWTADDELKSAPTNIYLQLRGDENGFKVSAVKAYQDSGVRIDHRDAYKHRVRCFTCAPSCVQ